MKHIIVCDDDLEIAEFLSICLKKEGYKIFECHNGKEAIACLKKNHIDLIIMDIMMPGEDGFKTVSRIREDSSVPVLFLSAKSEDGDKIIGFNSGGDDYMTKPFNPLELIARIKSILKRSSITDTKRTNDIYKNGTLKLEHSTKTVMLGQKVLKLTPIEYNIILFFMKNLGKVLSSNDIYKEVWNQNEAYNIDNTVAVHIRHIREKIEKTPRSPKFIKVVWGIGYKMEAI